MSNISFNPLAWAIKPLYDKAIAEDELFAKEVKEKESRAEKPKSLDECADYILGEAYEWASNHRNGNMGYSGLPDDEMVNLIKHYYDEDDIVIKKVSGAEAKVATTTTPAVPTAKKGGKTEKTAKVVPMGGLFTKQNPTQEKKNEEPKTYDLFAGMWGDEQEDEPQTEEAVTEPEEEDDDLPM